VASKAKHPTSRKFFEDVKVYRNEIARITNAKKHEHGRIDVLFGFEGDDVAVGYVVKDIVKVDGELRHRLDFNKIKTFHSSIRYHFYQFYRLSDRFVKHFLDSLKVIHGYDHLPEKVEIELDEFNRLTPFFDQLEFTVFPNSEALEAKTFINLKNYCLRLYYPVGVTEETVKYTVRQTMEDGSLVLYVPDEETLSKMKAMEALRPAQTSFDVPSDFRAKWQLVLLGFNQQDAAKEIRYNTGMRIRTWVDMPIVYSFIGGVELNKCDIIQAELNYLGLLKVS
jgi:hypothetical protein